MILCLALDCSYPDTTVVYHSVTSLAYPQQGQWQNYATVQTDGSVKGGFVPGTFAEKQTTCSSSPPASPTPTTNCNGSSCQTAPGGSGNPPLTPVASPTANCNGSSCQTSPGGSGNPPGPFEPTLAPTVAGCEDAFAVCPGISHCFAEIGMPNSADQWGWAMNVTSLVAGESLTCPVYIGASSCDLSQGVQVGTVTITPTSVTWKYDSSYGGTSFHFYAGSCLVSDAGMHLLQGGACEMASEVQWFRTPHQYSLISEYNSTYLNEFYFEAKTSSNYLLPTSIWSQKNYQPFPIGGSGYPYISLHSNVCPCGANSISCSSFTPPPTSAPTNYPTVAPGKPTSAPTSAPSSRPSTNQPSQGPSALDGTLGPDCMTAYVYCPGMSECFLGTYSNYWGWNIDLSLYNASMGSLVCPIYAGATGCLEYPEGNGTEVGIAQITSDSVTYILFSQFGADAFNMYAGDCPVNDGGTSLVSASGECTLKSMQQYARAIQTYTLGAGNKYAKLVNYFDFTANNYAAYIEPGSNWATANYNPFPLALGGGNGTRYLSLHTAACLCEVTLGCIPA